MMHSISWSNAGILLRENGILRPSGERPELLAYYAAASEAVVRTENDADAESISASAGS